MKLAAVDLGMTLVAALACLYLYGSKVAAIVFAAFLVIPPVAARIASFLYKHGDSLVAHVALIRPRTQTIRSARPERLRCPRRSTL